MDSKQPLVSVILLNYNGWNDTVECIRSLQDITYNNYKIIIVDNSSTDDSSQIIRNYIKNIENIEFIQAEKNLGFSYGNNIGIKRALENKSKYICLLNNDTIVERDFLEHLVKSLDNNSDIGIATGKIMCFSEREKIWSAGGYISEIKACGYHYGENEIDTGQYNEEREITFATGCLQLIRSELFAEIGLYDEDYFLYMEDTDFCYRTIKHGYKINYVPKSKIFHKVNASTGTGSKIALYYSNRNRIIFINKNITKVNLKICAIIYVIATRVIKMLRCDKRKYKINAIYDGFLNKVGPSNI